MMGTRVSSYLVFFVVIIGILTFFSGCVEKTSYKKAQYLDAKEKEMVDFLIVTIYMEAFNFEREMPLRDVTIYSLPRRPYEKLDPPIKSISLISVFTLSKNEVKNKISPIISRKAAVVTTPDGKEKSLEITDYDIEYIPTGFETTITIIPIEVKVSIK